MYCKYLNLRNNEELAQITMRKRNSTLNQSTLNCPGLLLFKIDRSPWLSSSVSAPLIACRRTTAAALQYSTVK